MGILAVATVSALLVGQVILACPFCSPLPGVRTVQRILAENEYALVVRPARTGDGDGTPGTRVIVTRVLRGAGIRPGRPITLERNAVLRETARYLLLGKDRDLSKARVRVLRSDVLAFFDGVAALPPRTM